MIVLASAQMELNATAAEPLVKAALKHNISRSVDETYDIGDKGMVRRERERERRVPRKEEKNDDKIVHVKNYRGHLQLLHKQLIKPYIRNPIDFFKIFLLKIHPFQSVVQLL